MNAYLFPELEAADVPAPRYAKEVQIPPGAGGANRPEPGSAGGALPSAVRPPAGLDRPKVRHADYVAAFEALLRARQVPYVAIDEAKRAAFHDAKLAAFDFIVYAESGDNWLVRIGGYRSEWRAKMAEWEAVFGDGFKAVFAVPTAGGFTYRALDGAELTAGALPAERTA